MVQLDQCLCLMLPLPLRCSPPFHQIRRQHSAQLIRLIWHQQPLLQQHSSRRQRASFLLLCLPFLQHRRLCRWLSSSRP